MLSFDIPLFTIKLMYDSPLFVEIRRGEGIEGGDKLVVGIRGLEQNNSITETRWLTYISMNNINTFSLRFRIHRLIIEEEVIDISSQRSLEVLEKKSSRNLIIVRHGEALRLVPQNPCKMRISLKFDKIGYKDIAASMSIECIT